MNLHQCPYATPIIYLVQALNLYIQKYISGNYGWELSTLVVRNKTSNWFIIYIGPNVEYIIHNFITPIFMRLYNWSNTVLSQISHYTGVHI